MSVSKKSRGQRLPRDGSHPAWYYSHGGIEYGPLNDTQFFQALREGAILATDTVTRPDIGWQGRGDSPVLRTQLRVHGIKPAPMGAAPTGVRMLRFLHDNLEYGPMTEDELIRAADNGVLLPTDQVWEDGSTELFLARDVEGLFPQEGSVPQADGETTDDSPPETSPTVSGAAEATRERMRRVYGDLAGSGQVDAVPVRQQFTLSNSGDLTCPHCWHRFNHDQKLYISENPEMRGDPVLGPEEYRRFRPSRFTPDGHAIDSEGSLCYEVACPRCHLRIPRMVMDTPPLFLSIVGAPASGKSYYLASMCQRLTTTLPQAFEVEFTDVDGKTNRWINEYQEKLFMQADDQTFQIIRKTELQGDHYRELTLDGKRLALSLPSMFRMRAREYSLFHSKANNFINRCLVLYDNAGEHFQPGENHASTHHLMRAEALLFLLDPTKDPRFRKAIVSNKDVQLRRRQTVQKQDTLLTETINRIKVFLGTDATRRYEKPAVVIVSKADVLSDLMPPHILSCLQQDPWVWDERIQSHALNLSVLFQVSFFFRAVLNAYMPEIVSTAESLLDDVLYVPASALGHSPSVMDGHEDDEKAPLVVRPCNVKPMWVETPFLYVMYRLGYLEGVATQDEDRPVPEKYEVRGGLFHFLVPGTSELVRIPVAYAGFSLQCPKTGQWFRVPEIPADSH